MKVSLRRFERCQSNAGIRSIERVVVAVVVAKNERARAHDRAEKNRRIVRRGTHSVDALRAATPFVVVVVAVPSKTSLDRRRGVVVDEDAVETSDDAARRRNMDGRGRNTDASSSGRRGRRRLSTARRLFARRSSLRSRPGGYRPLGQNLESRTVIIMIHDVRM